MLYVFTGTNSYEVKLETQKWKKLFAEKHGDFNLTHIRNFAEVETNFIAEALLSNSLFASKKLVILDIDGTERKTVDLEKKYEFLTGNISKISPDTILLISFPKPDKRGKFYKDIIKLAEKVHVYDEKNAYDLQTEIEKRYSGKIARWALELLIRYKSGNQEKVVSEIEKLSILYEKIELTHIQTHITPELEESIFVLVDSILSKNKKLFLETFSILSQDTNMYLLYNSLLANLRTSFYIGLLKSKKLPAYTIKTQLSLWNRGFLVDKTYALKYSELQELYSGFITLDRQMKTGYFMGSEDTDFLFEIEREVLKII